jgi:hypothetical protein
MKFEFAGKYAWHGVFIDAEDKEEIPFITYADDVASAVKASQETLPEGAEIVALGREVIPDNQREFEVDNPELERALKNKVN